MFESKGHAEVEMGSERSFGIVFAVVFLGVGLYPQFGEGGFNAWSFPISAVFLLLAFFAPRALTLPNRVWFKLGMLLGAVIAPLVMALVYFSTVVPLGVIMRLMGKDLLRQKMDGDASTYWITRDQAVGSMKDQF